MTEITEDEIYQVKEWLNPIIGDIEAELSLDLDDEEHALLFLKIKNYYNSQNLNLNVYPQTFYEKAKLGDSQSMFDFGNILFEACFNGDLEEKYKHISVYWILKAAFNLVPEALTIVGNIYSGGNYNRIPKDTEKGVYLFNLGNRLLTTDYIEEAKNKEIEHRKHQDMMANIMLESLKKTRRDRIFQYIFWPLFIIFLVCIFYFGL
tara:strand:+ start:73 stop:690 length:618 start_codon:yes stop_codon:yes gene_type:complete